MENIISNNLIDNFISFLIFIDTFYKNNNKKSKYLYRCLNSILKQKYNNWTIIIVGDKYALENELLYIIDNLKKK